MADGDQTISITSSTLAKIAPRHKDDVWEIVLTGSFDDDDVSAATTTFPLNGMLRKIVVELPATTTTGTTSQVLIKDNGSNTIFDSTEKAEGSTYTFDVEEPLSGNITVSIEPSDVAGAGGCAPVITLRGI